MYVIVYTMHMEKFGMSILFCETVSLIQLRPQLLGRLTGNEFLYLLAEEWGYRWMPVHLASYVITGDLNSGPNACIAGISPAETSPQPPKRLRVFFN